MGEPPGSEQPGPLVGAVVVQKSLNWTTANCVFGTTAWTPFTLLSASVLAWVIDGPMLEVVSIAISMSALGGVAGTLTILPSSVVLVPALSVNDAVAGLRVASVVAASTMARAAVARSVVSAVERFVLTFFLP